MKLNVSHPFWQVISLGIIAGMRTASSPAIASHILSRHHSQKLAGSALNFMQSDKVALAMKIFAFMEFVGDKLPNAPNRIKNAGVVGRCLSGSLAGASIYKANGRNALFGALLGVTVAFGSTYGSYFLRKIIVNKFNIFDPVIGAIEDVLVVGAGVGLIAGE